MMRETEEDIETDAVGLDSQIASGLVSASAFAPQAPEESDSVPDANSLLSQGVSFLGNLVQTLKNPEQTKQLVDTLVKEDPETGKTTIQIPVSGKDAVMDFMKLLGKLM